MANGTWKERSERGIATENRFIEHVRNRYGLNVVRTSQHLHHPESKLARHFPDIFVMECGAFVQVKNGKNSGPHKNVIGEEDSIDACRALHEMGNIVWVVWELPDGSFDGNEIQHLVIGGKISDEARRRGSGTPAYKIRKSSLRKLTELIHPQPKLMD